MVILQILIPNNIYLCSKLDQQQSFLLKKMVNDGNSITKEYRASVKEFHTLQ